MSSVLDSVKAPIRAFVHQIARGLNSLSGGKITPNFITFSSLVMHVPIAATIAGGKNELAAVLLIVFGLFDTLDGELARLQNRASPKGMFLDSTTDRIKEVILYCGIVAFLFDTSGKLAIIAAVGALGSSLVTSYVNAWGEVAIAASPKKAAHQVNKALRTGLLGLEMRMALIVIGLIFNQLEIVVYVILILAIQTFTQRILNTLRKL